MPPKGIPQRGRVLLGKFGSILAMRATKLLAMSLVVVASLALAGIGGTFATWSDSETSYNNTIETGSVDLLVAKCDADWQNPGAPKDDEPWGEGLDPCFAASLAPGANYSCYSLLWNAGDIDADAYLHIDNVSESNALSNSTIMRIWYDDDGDPGTPLEEVVAGDTIANLDSREIELGPLPAGAIRQLKLEVEYFGPCPTSGLGFDIIFDVVGDGFADTETSQNYFSGPQ